MGLEFPSFLAGLLSGNLEGKKVKSALDTQAESRRASKARTMADYSRVGAQLGMGAGGEPEITGFAPNPFVSRVNSQNDLMERRVQEYKRHHEAMESANASLRKIQEGRLDADLLQTVASRVRELRDPAWTTFRLKGASNPDAAKKEHEAETAMYGKLERELLGRVGMQFHKLVNEPTPGGGGSPWSAPGALPPGGGVMSGPDNLDPLGLGAPKRRRK